MARELAAPVNSVSAAVAEQMAAGACALFGADLGVATTGYAEPSADWKVTEPFAWWALAFVRRPARGACRTRSGRVDCPGASRTDVQERVAVAALDALIALLTEIRAPQGAPPV